MKTTTKLPITKLPKEQLNAVKFYKYEVLFNKEQRQQRLQKLQRALILGNIEHVPVMITFQTEDEKLQQVEATVWSVSDKFVLLKGGLYIPIHAITDVEF
jgi:uncharacterized protein (UPF0248 family)